MENNTKEENKVKGNGSNHEAEKGNPSSTMNGSNKHPLFLGDTPTGTVLNLVI